MKSTKKSLFITTIAMVVLMVVALSTATFAWYTSSSTVSATATQVSTATTSAANIAIGWTTSATDTSVTFEPAANLLPMVPTAAFEIDTTTHTNAVASMTTGSYQMSGSTAIFAADGIAATPWTQAQYTADESAGAVTLYLVNYNTSQDQTVTISLAGLANVEDTPTVVDNFHLAVFAQEAADADVVYKGLLGNTAANYGTIEEGETALTDAGTIATSAVSVTIPAATGATGGTVRIALIGWIDGVVLDNALAGGAVTFGLTIQAA